jgi:hypothetical protein
MAQRARTFARRLLSTTPSTPPVKQSVLQATKEWHEPASELTQPLIFKNHQTHLGVLLTLVMTGTLRDASIPASSSHAGVTVKLVLFEDFGDREHVFTPVVQCCRSHLV